MFRMEALLSGLLQADTVGKDNIILLLAFSQKAFQYPKGAKLLGNSKWFPILRKITDPHYSWAPHLRVHLFMQICLPPQNQHSASNVVCGRVQRARDSSLGCSQLGWTRRCSAFWLSCHAADWVLFLAYLVAQVLAFFRNL